MPASTSSPGVHEGEWLTLDSGKLVNAAGSVVAEGTVYTTEILEDHLDMPGLVSRIRSRHLPKTP